MAIVFELLARMAHSGCRYLRAMQSSQSASVEPPEEDLHIFPAQTREALETPREKAAWCKTRRGNTDFGRNADFLHLRCKSLGKSLPRAKPPSPRV